MLPWLHFYRNSPSSILVFSHHTLSVSLSLCRPLSLLLDRFVYTTSGRTFGLISVTRPLLTRQALLQQDHGRARAGDAGSLAGHQPRPGCARVS